MITIVPFLDVPGCPARLGFVRAMRDPGLEIAIKAAGGVASLARGIGIAQPSVSAWSRIPAKRVLAVEALTQVDRYILRPDLYGSFGNHAASTHETGGVVDRLGAGEYKPLSRLPEDGSRERFATLNLFELGLTRVETRSPDPLPNNERSLEQRVREALVAELKRQAASYPQSLSVSDSADFVINGVIDLDSLAVAIASTAIDKRSS
jgi:DNA-binding transcriptional regulator YdaS (Cro superfamily)